MLSKFNCTLRWKQRVWFIQLGDIFFCYWSGFFLSSGVGFSNKYSSDSDVWFVDGKSTNWCWCSASRSVSVTCRAPVVSTVHTTCKKQVFFRKWTTVEKYLFKVVQLQVSRTDSITFLWRAKNTCSYFFFLYASFYLKWKCNMQKYCLCRLIFAVLLPVQIFRTSWEINLPNGEDHPCWHFDS